MQEIPIIPVNNYRISDILCAQLLGIAPSAPT